MPSLKYTAEQADEILAKAGYDPEEPYPGRTLDIWRVKCRTCGRSRRVRFGHIVSGYSVCKHRRTFAKRSVIKNLPVERIVKRYDEENLGIRSLAKEYGVGFGTMQKLLSKNTKMRPRGGPPQH